MQGADRAKPPYPQMQSATLPHPGTLHTRTRERLKADGRSLPVIANASGLPFYWLKKFSANEIADPSVNRIQRLYEFLSKRPLKVA